MAHGYDKIRWSVLGRLVPILVKIDMRGCFASSFSDRGPGCRRHDRVGRMSQPSGPVAVRHRSVGREEIGQPGPPDSTLNLGRVGRSLAHSRFEGITARWRKSGRADVHLDTEPPRNLAGPQRTHESPRGSQANRSRCTICPVIVSRPLIGESAHDLGGPHRAQDMKGHGGWLKGMATASGQRLPSGEGVGEGPQQRQGLVEGLAGDERFDGAVELGLDGRDLAGPIAGRSASVSG